MVQTPPIKPTENLTKTPPQSVRETINWLNRLGRPPLPECPIEAAKQGKEPKQPCFLDGKYLKTVNWKQWQHTQPIEEIYTAWFKNPQTGIGTLGGWNNKHWLGWIDFDQKDFDSPEECDRAVAEWLEQYPLMKDAPMFRTPSGGYRFLVAFNQEPENFKANSGFSLKPDGSHHVGELLSKNGGHTLLPPTVGVTGKAYQWVQWSEYPPAVNQPEDVGLYPVQKKTEAKAHTTRVNNWTYGTTLTDLLRGEVYPQLSLEQAFNWHGHDFKQHGSKLKGNCPWHDSQSGTAFYAEFKDGSPVWRCPACELGGSVIEYRHRFAGGNGSPRGSEFVALVKDLASEVGVSVSESNHSSNGSSHRDSGTTSDNGGDKRDRTAEGDKPSNIKSPQLTIRDAISKAEEILETETDSLAQKIKLEELRQQTGINSYEWNVEYINLIRSKLERQLAQDSRKEQRRQALLAIACEKDPDEREDLIVALCRKSGWRRQYVESRVDSLKAEEIKPKAQRMTFKEFMEAESEPVKWIYSGLIPLLGVTLFSGDAGAGKSSTATDLAVSFLSGDEFLGEVPGVPGRVLYVIDDEPDGFLRERLMHRFPLIECPEFEIIPHWDVSQMDLLIETIKDFRPTLVIVDSYNSIHSTDPNYDENSSKAGKTIRTFDALSQTYGCGFVVIHHNGKGKDRQGVHKVRGSTDIPAAASTVLLFEKCPNGVYRQIKVEKTRAGIGNRTLTVGFDESTKRLILVNSGAEDKEAKSLSQHILKFLESNQGTFFEQAEVQMHLQLNNSNSVYAALKRLADRSQITRRPSKKINAGKRCLIYGIPATVTPPPHTKVTPPPVCVKVSDLEAENYIQQELAKSDIESDTKSDINLTWELSNEYQNSSNADSVDNSVNLTDNMAVGCVCSDPGVSDSTVTLTPDNAIAHDPWEEKYTVINVNADGWGEIVRKEEAIAPTPDECENPVIPVEIEPEAVQALVEDEIGVDEESAANKTKWAWSRTTGECLGKVLCIRGNQAKTCRSGELPRKAKFHALKDITFDNPVDQPVTQALSLNVSSVANTQWEGEQFLEELDD